LRRRRRRTLPAALVAGVEGEGLDHPLARLRAARSELLRPPSGDGSVDALRLRSRYNDATRGLTLQMSAAADWPAMTGRLMRCARVVGRSRSQRLKSRAGLSPRRPFADTLLAQAAGGGGGGGAALSNVAVALQPHGAEPLDALEASLGLAGWQAAPTRAVLSSRGNPSGAGALMALCLAVEDAALTRSARAGGGLWGALRSSAAAPRHLLALALGPGVTAEGLLLEL
jgi:hypothetical protein